MFKLLISIVVLLSSCSSWVSYDLKESNDVIIYNDSLITIQRSTEILGDELMVSHLVNKKKDFSLDLFSIKNISDKINNLNPKDSLSFYQTCKYKKYWYRNFSEISPNFKNLENCGSYQIIYYYPLKETKKNIIITTNLEFIINGKGYATIRIDTLTKNKKYHIPQL